MEIDDSQCAEITKNSFFNFLRCYRELPENINKSAATTAKSGAEIWKKMEVGKKKPFRDMAVVYLKSDSNNFEKEDAKLNAELNKSESVHERQKRANIEPIMEMEDDNDFELPKRGRGRPRKSSTTRARSIRARSRTRKNGRRARSTTPARSPVKRRRRTSSRMTTTRARSAPTRRRRARSQTATTRTRSSIRSRSRTRRRSARRSRARSRVRDQTTTRRRRTQRRSRTPISRMRQTRSHSSAISRGRRGTRRRIRSRARTTSPGRAMLRRSSPRRQYNRRRSRSRRMSPLRMNHSQRSRSRRTGQKEDLIYPIKKSHAELEMVQHEHNKMKDAEYNGTRKVKRLIEKNVENEEEKSHMMDHICCPSKPALTATTIKYDDSVYESTVDTHNSMKTNNGQNKSTNSRSRSKQQKLVISDSESDKSS